MNYGLIKYYTSITILVHMYSRLTMKINRCNCLLHFNLSILIVPAIGWEVMRLSNSYLPCRYLHKDILTCRLI